MFQIDNGRGVHPRLRQSSHRFWPMDDVVRGTVVDLSPNGVDLANGAATATFNPPMIVDGMIGGKAQRFENVADIQEVQTSGVTIPQNNNLSSVGDTASRDLHEGGFTFSFWFRSRSPSTSTGTKVIYSYTGDNDLETEAENWVFSVRTTRTSSGDPLLFAAFWEYDAGAQQTQYTWSNYQIPLNQWIFVTVRKRMIVVGTGSSGVVFLDLFVNGQLVQTRYSVGSITTPAGTWTWDGTTTVLSNDTSGVAVNDMIRRNSDSGMFRIVSIVANVSVLIGNPDALVIPTGAGIERQDHVYNTSGGTNAVYILGSSFDGAAVTPGQPTFGTHDLAGAYLYGEEMAAEEIEDDFRRGHLLPFYHRLDLGVVVEGPPPTSQRFDMTNYLGNDWVIGADIGDKVDMSTIEATVTFMRDHENLSLATLKTDTPANLETLNDVTSFDPILNVNRSIEILTARVPLGLRATPRDMVRRFKGVIDDVDWGSEQISVRARDEGGVLIDTYIEQERDYGAGATASLEATIQQILDDNDSPNGGNAGSYDERTLFTPSPSLWVLDLQDGEPVQQLKTRREPVMSLIRALSGQIAFECRYRFDNDPDFSSWRFTLYEPDRDRLDQDIILRPGEVLQVGQAKITAQRVRNVVRIVYPSSEAAATAPTTASPSPYVENWVNSGPDGNGFRTVAYIEIESPVSYARYGRKFMEVQERGSSQIDSIDEAQRMAIGILKDLEEPEFEHGVTIIPLPELDICDMVKFDKNEKLFTGQQRLAVVSVNHKLGERPTTTIQLRGRPSAGFLRWLQMETKPGVMQSAGPPVISPSESLTDVQRGSLMQFVTGLIDRTGYFKGGKFIGLLNPEFEFWTLGSANPPDAWRVTAGTWGTDMARTLSSATGGYAVNLGPSTTPRLAANVIPIEGDVNTPYSLEMRYKVANTSLSRHPAIDIEWYQADKTTLDGTTTHRLGTDFGATPADSNWHTVRQDGIYPSAATSRFAKVILRVTGGGVLASSYFDKVNLYRTARKASTKLDGAAVGAWGLVNDTTVAGNQSFAGSGDNDILYDHGNGLVDDSSGNPNNGNHYLVREEGEYDINVFGWPRRSAGTVAVTLRLHIRLNATYDAAGLVATGGTIVKFIDKVINFTGGIPDVAMETQHTMYLSEGDRVSTTLEWVAGGTGQNHYLTNGVTDSPSVFSIRQRPID